MPTHKQVTETLDRLTACDERLTLLRALLANIEPLVQNDVKLIDEDIMRKAVVAQISRTIGARDLAIDFLERWGITIDENI
jgi:hypothetical protein